MKTPYEVLGSWDAVSAGVMSIALHRRDDDTRGLILLAARLRELHAEMFEALQAAQRPTLEAQLEASIEKVKRERQRPAEIQETA
jgi:hypothetical protein